MTRFLPLFTFATAVTAMAAAAPQSAAQVDRRTATVNVRITVLPYATVELDQTSVQVTFVEGATYFGPVTVGGTVRCNVPVQLSARVTPPAGAPGTWVAETMVSSIGNAGVYHFSQLLSLSVSGLPAGVGGQSYPVLMQGQFAPNLGGIHTPLAGVVTLTVVPQ